MPKSPKGCAARSRRTPRPWTTVAPTTSSPRSVPTGRWRCRAWATTRVTTSYASAYDKWKPRRPQRHLVVNTLVTDWDDDEAHAISDVIFIMAGESGWAIQVVGRYHDTLHHDAGTWRFHRRVAEFLTSEPEPAGVVGIVWMPRSHPFDRVGASGRKTYRHLFPPRVTRSCMAEDESSHEWAEVLDDLARRREASRAMGGDERLRKHRDARQARRPRPHRLPARPGIVPGARHARRRRGRAGRRGRDGFGAHRRPPGDGRGRGLHREGGHDQRGGELEALPRRRDRGHRPRAADHDAGGRRLPRRRSRARARPPHRHARPGPLLRAGAAGHRRARRVGRTRRAGRAHLRLRGDERPRRRSSPPGRRSCCESIGETDHEGRPRRPGRRARERPDPQRRRRRRARARSRPPVSLLLPDLGVVVPARTWPGADDGPRARSRDPRHRAAQRPARLRHAQGDRRRVRRRFDLRGAARVRPAGHHCAVPPRRASGRRHREPAAGASRVRSTPMAPTRPRTSSPSPTRSICRSIFLSDNPGVLPGSKSEQQAILRKGARMYAAQTLATSPKFEVTLRKAYGFGSMVMGMIPFDGQSAVFAFPGVTMGAMGAAAMSRSRGSDEDEAAMLVDHEVEASYRSAHGVRLRRAHRPTRDPQRAPALARTRPPPPPGPGRTRRAHRHRTLTRRTRMHP